MDDAGRGFEGSGGMGAAPGRPPGPAETAGPPGGGPPRGEMDGADWPNRRDFLRGVAASFAAAGVGGLGGCVSRRQAIVPYVVPPEQVVPGRPLFFATAAPIAGYGIGVLAESHMGRPTKIEGNPDHPASLGSTDARTQASVLSLYDPDRAQTVTRAGLVATWAEFVRTISAQMQAVRATGGAGLRLLTGAVTSPTLAGQIRALMRDLPGARWHCFEPASGDGERLGTQLAFGRPLRTVYRLDRARRILSLDSDFLINGPGAVRYNRDFAAGREVRIGAGAGDGGAQAPAMHRLYVVESTPTTVGAMADHRLALRAGEIEGAARRLLDMVRAGGGAASGSSGGGDGAWLGAVAGDLLGHRGASLVIAGEYQPPAVHALAAALNAALGAVGATVDYIEPVEALPDGERGSLRGLVEEMNAGAVSLLVMLDTNPVYTAPADLGFAAALDRVPLRIHQSEYYDETSFRCHWHVPQTHYLEMWGDVRAFDGTAGIVQPLIHPLFQSRSPHELLAVLLGTPDAEPLELVRETWRGSAPEGTDFELHWRTILERGVIPGTAAAPVQVGEPRDVPPAAASRAAGAGMEIIFRPDPNVFDGRFANNGWLQELPRPLTKVTWDNVAAIGVGTAARLGVRSGDVLRLRRGGREVRAPAWVQPGHPEDAVSVTLGYGRTRGGRQATGTGFDAYALRASEAPWFGAGLEVERARHRHALAVTQPQQTDAGRDPVRVYPVEQLPLAAGGPPDGAPGGPGSGAGAGRTVHLSLYPPMPGSGIIHGHAWGMAIDLNLCTGCNACVVACQAENNVAVVGKEQVLAQREMHWLRIDTYYREGGGGGDEGGGAAGPYFQPMLCQHCENAPCEYVCPVVATTHSAEGINEMTYNRCIGTRYCANNCPYKVRRFNFLQYSDNTPLRELQYNPDVTVRTRGVMEKCTFCVQRLNAARRDEKSLRSTGEPDADAKADAAIAGVRTACQQACPTGAIVFGELTRPGKEAGRGGGAEVLRRRGQPHSYGVLTELNTGPRVTYLARLANPNPALGGGGAAGAGEGMTR